MRNFRLLTQKFTKVWLFYYMTPSYAPEPPTFDAPDYSVFEHLVKSYYHVKFWAFSLKIDQVMAILVHDPPLMPLNPQL